MLLDDLPWVSRFLRKANSAPHQQIRDNTKLQGQERSFQGKYLSWASLPASSSAILPRTYESRYFATLMHAFAGAVSSSIRSVSKEELIRHVSTVGAHENPVLAMYVYVAQHRALLSAPVPRPPAPSFATSEVVPVLHPTSVWDVSTRDEMPLHRWSLFDTSSLRCVNGQVVTVAFHPEAGRPPAVCPSFARVGFTIPTDRDPEHALACHAAQVSKNDVFCLSPGLAPFTVFNSFTSETERKIQVNKARKAQTSGEGLARYFHRALSIISHLEDETCMRLLPAPAISASFELSGATNKYMVLRLNHVKLPEGHVPVSDWFPASSTLEMPIYVRAVGDGSPSMRFSRNDVSESPSFSEEFQRAVVEFHERLLQVSQELLAGCGLSAAELLPKPCALPVDQFFEAVCRPDRSWTREVLSEWAYDQTQTSRPNDRPVDIAGDEEPANMYTIAWQRAFDADKRDVMMRSEGLFRRSARPDRLTLASPSPLFYDLAPCVYPKAVMRTSANSLSDQPLVVFTQLVLRPGAQTGAREFSDAATLFCERLRAAFVDDGKLSLLTVTHGPGTNFIPMGLTRIRHVAKATVGRSLCKASYAQRDGKFRIDRIDVEQSEATENFHRRMTLDALPDALRTTRAAHDTTLVQQMQVDDVHDVPVTISYVPNRPEEHYEAGADQGLRHLQDVERDRRVVLERDSLAVPELPRARFSEFARQLAEEGVVRPDLHAFPQADARLVAAVRYEAHTSAFLRSLRGAVTQWDDLMSFFAGEGGRVCCSSGWIEHGLIRREMLVTGALANVRHIGLIFAHNMRRFASELPSTRQSGLREVITHALHALDDGDCMAVLRAARRIREASGAELQRAARADRFQYLRLVEYARRTMETISMLPSVVRPDGFEDATPLDVAALLRCCAPLYRSAIGGMLERVDAAGPAWWTPRHVVEARDRARRAVAQFAGVAGTAAHGERAPTQGRDAWAAACREVEAYAHENGLFVADAARSDETSYNNPDFYHLVAAVAAAMCRPVPADGRATYPRPVVQALGAADPSKPCLQAATQQKAMWRCADRIAQQGMILSATDHQERSTEVVEIVKREVELIMEADGLQLTGEYLRRHVYEGMMEYIDREKFEVNRDNGAVNYKNPRGLTQGQAFINSRRLQSRSDIVKQMVDVWSGQQPALKKRGYAFSGDDYGDGRTFFKPFVPQVMFFATRPEVPSQDFCDRLVEKRWLDRAVADRFYGSQKRLQAHGYSAVTIPQECIRSQRERTFEVYDVVHSPSADADVEQMLTRMQTASSYLVPVSNYDGIIQKIVKEEYTDQPLVKVHVGQDDPAHMSNTLLRHLVDAELGRATVSGAKIITVMDRRGGSEADGE